MVTLIADSGSTKTDWRLVDSEGRIQQQQTEGYNPLFITPEQMRESLRQQLLPALENMQEPVSQVFFYGSGCGTAARQAEVAATIQEAFPGARVDVQSDMLGAARALCNKTNGMAVILGTGSNSCLSDGFSVTASRPSLGFILGDEGSGADIGKKLLTDYLYGNLPQSMQARFEKRFGDDRAVFIENVYRKPFPNRYLASFSKFVYQNLNEIYCSDMVADRFRAFFRVHIMRYENWQQLPMHCTGSVAFYYSNILRAVAAEQGVRIGTITETPIAALALYHLE